MKKIFVILSFVFSLCFITACGNTGRNAATDTPDDVIETPVPDELEPGDQSETEDTEPEPDGLMITSAESGNFYIEHNGNYYALYDLNRNSDYYELYPDEENNLPVFYPGDTLIYYSHEGILEDMYWEKFTPYLYTFGVNGFHILSDGRCYCSTSTDVKETSSFTEFNLSALPVIVSVNGQTFSEKYISENGYILGIQPYVPYEINYYEGTINKTLTAYADVYLFTPENQFKSCAYTPLDDGLTFLIHLPEYFTPGYYTLNGYGSFIIAGEETEINTDRLYLINDAYYTDLFEEVKVTDSGFTIIYGKKNKLNVITPVTDETKKDTPDTQNPEEDTLAELPENDKPAITITDDGEIIIPDGIPEEELTEYLKKAMEEKLNESVLSD